MKNKNIVLAILINIFITLAETAIGLFIGSLALISDAVHNFADVGALVFTWWGEKAKEKDSNKYKTYGYKRVEILVALFNSLVLAVVVVFILIEAIGRIFNPSTITAGVMIWAAGIAFIGNILATFLLKKDAHKNLNAKSAWLHSLQDALFSLGVVAGAIIIYFSHLYIIDPLISILLSLYILREVYELIKQAVDILMESVPSDIDFEAVKTRLEGMSGVIRAQDIHIWQTDSESRFLSAHLEIKDLNNEKRNCLLSDIQNILLKEFNISHPTIQLVASDGQNNSKLNCQHCN